MLDAVSVNLEILFSKIPHRVALSVGNRDIDRNEIRVDAQYVFRVLCFVGEDLSRALRRRIGGLREAR